MHVTTTHWRQVLCSTVQEFVFPHHHISLRFRNDQSAQRKQFHCCTCHTYARGKSNMTCSTVCPTGILRSWAYNGAIVLCICALFGSHSWSLYWYMCTMHLRHGDPAAVCLCSYWQRKGLLCTELLGTALFSCSTSQYAVKKTSYNPHTRWLHANTFTCRLAHTAQCVRPLQGWKIRHTHRTNREEHRDEMKKRVLETRRLQVTDDDYLTSDMDDDSRNDTRTMRTREG